MLFGLYELVRTLADANLRSAWGNAYAVLHFEQSWHLPGELTLQQYLLAAPWLVEVANGYYAWVHFPATAAFLVWAFVARPLHYPTLRSWLVLVTAAATIGHLLFPLAPPRMMSHFGFVDTAARYGPAVYSEPDVASIANQYAAMPSLHVAWAVVVGGGLMMLTRSRWRWLWLVHPVITVLVVVATANHYWIDAIVAVALLALCWPVVAWLRRRRLSAETLAVAAG